MRISRPVIRTGWWLTRLVLVPLIFYLVAANSSAQASATQIASATQLWVDGANGNDANTGLAVTSAFRTIQKDASRAGPGTTVRILPAVYREAVCPLQSGSSTAPITYVAEQESGTVTLRGSESSASFTGTALTANALW